MRTERLYLRMWRAGDLAPFAAINADPRVAEFLTGEPMGRAESDAMAGRIALHFDRFGYGLWAVEVPGIADFVGFVGLSIPSFDAHFTPCVEVGWRIAPACWGRGYATEGARAAVDFGFTQLKLDQVVSFTVPHNGRSRRVMEKLGMYHDIAGDFDHPRLPEGHPLRRHVLYRLPRALWEMP